MTRHLITLVLALALVGSARTQIAFAPATTFHTGDRVDGMAVADFDGDGDLDIVVDNDFTISLLLNDGTGTFGPRLLFPVSFLGLSTLACDDFNGDGLPDIAAGSTTSTTFLDSQLLVVLNDGNGGFLPSVPYPMPSSEHASSLATGDLNGDGTIDVVAGTDHFDQIHVFFNDGTGALFLGPSLASLDARGVAVADVDGDTDLDIVATRDSTAGSMIIHLNNGLGGFTPAGDYPFGPANMNGSSWVSVVDIDGDTDLDLVGSRTPTAGHVPGTGGLVAVLRNDGNGTFGSSINTPVGDSVIRGVTSDLDGDGFPEVVLVDAIGALVHVIANDGTGTLNGVTTFAGGSGPRSPVVADFNGDGRPDIAVPTTASDDVAILINQTPTAGQTVPYPGSLEDLVLGTGINAPPSSGLVAYVKTASSGDIISLDLDSPGGAFTLAPFAIAGQFFATGSPPAGPPAFSEVHLDLATAFVILDGISGGPLGQLLLPETGIGVSAIVPTGLDGLSLMLQGFGVAPFAANGIFAATDGYETQFTAPLP